MLLLITFALIFSLFRLMDSFLIPLNFKEQYPVVEELINWVFLLLIFLVYRFIVKQVERRKVYELSLGRFAIEMITGLFIGAVLISVVVVVLIFLGYYRILGFNSVGTLLDGFITFTGGALFEELLFRLVVFRLLEELTGSWLALLLSAFLFGFAHIFNENATLWSAFAIAVEAGFLLGVAFMLTRRIWFAFGIHLGWNFMMGSVYGIPTSGIDFGGLIQSEIAGPVWITGGQFGVEASVLTVVLGLILALFLLKKVIADGQVSLPSWRRNHKAEIIY